MYRQLSKTFETLKVRACGSSRNWYKCKTLLTRQTQSLCLRSHSLKSMIKSEIKSIER